MPDRTYSIIATMDNSKLVAGAVGAAVALKGMDAAIAGMTANLAAINIQLQATASHMQGVAAAGSKVTTSNKQASSSLMGFSAGTIVLAAGAAAAMDYAANMEAIKQATAAAAEVAIKYRDTLREIAALKGEGGPNNKVLGQALQLSHESGLTPEEVDKFDEQFENRAPAGRIAKNIDAKTEADLKVEGARLGQRLKLDPSTAGGLAGGMSQYGKIENVEHGAQKLGKIMMALNRGGQNSEGMVRALTNASGALVNEDGGALENQEDLAVFIGAQSTHASAAASGTQSIQAVSALRRPTTPEKAEAFERIGFKPEMRHRERLDMLKKYVDKNRPAGIGVDVFLQQEGFDRQTEVRSISQQYNDYDFIQDTFAEQAKVKGKDVMDADEAFRAKDISGVASQAEADKRTTIILEGEYNERDVVRKRNAELRLKQSGGVVNMDPKSRTTTQWAFDQVNFSDSDTGRERDIRLEALKDLEGQATRLKIPQAKIDEALERKDFLGLGISALKYDPDEGSKPSDRVRRVNALSDLVEKAGGAPGGTPVDLKPSLDRLIKATEDNTKEMQRQGGGAAPAPAQAPAPVGRPLVVPRR